MKRQPLRPLDDMDEKQAYDFLAEQLAHLSAEEEYELRHQDYVMAFLASDQHDATLAAKDAVAELAGRCTAV